MKVINFLNDKISLIKFVRSLTSLGLVEAKSLVEYFDTYNEAYPYDNSLQYLANLGQLCSLINTGEITVDKAGRVLWGKPVEVTIYQLAEKLNLWGKTYFVKHAME